MVELPWSKSTVDVLDIGKARTDLDVDHYGLEKLKKRLGGFVSFEGITVDSRYNDTVGIREKY